VGFIIVGMLVTGISCNIMYVEGDAGPESEDVFQSAEVFIDDAGDTFGFESVQHDILSVEVAPGSIMMRVRFNGSISPPSPGMNTDEILGYIELDTDQNGMTGATPIMDIYGGPSGLGIEYSIRLFEYDTSFRVLPVYDDTGNLAGYVSADFTVNAVTLEIPLSVVGNDDGNVDIGIILGTWSEPTDIAGPFSYKLMGKYINE
jgi:hypothetical protein